MFWDMEIATDPLMELLQKEDTRLREILEEGTMLQEFRTGHQELTSYFSREDIITELCEWSMTLKYEKETKFEHLSRLSTEVLVCGGSSYSTILLNSKSFKTFCSNFLGNDDEWDSICVGHFQKIFVHLLRQSSGKYLEFFPNIIEDLTNHLNLISVVEFIIILETEFTKYLPKRFVPIISRHIKSNLNNSNINIFISIYALRQIFLKGFEEELIKESFTTENVLLELIESAKILKDKISKIEIYRLIKNLQEKSTKIQEIIHKYDNEFYLNKDLNSAIKSFSSLNIKHSNEECLQMILQTNIHWSIIHQLIQQLQIIPKEELLTIINKTKAIEILQENIRKQEINPQQLQLLQIIIKYNKEILQEIPEEIQHKIQLLNQKYGGEIPIGFEKENKINAE